ncbi:MAG: SGNH/GDSL hydrolase family protein [Lachnospiraceae bacterium]|nr:SGNH/GDSL hydrolase family protein [Lachnospiraceae bacterium]
MRIVPGNDEKYNMDRVEALPDSPLRGETVLFLGSSVTRGARSYHDGIPEYFGKRFGVNVIKEAVSGTTLCDDDEVSYIHRLLHKVDPSAPVRLFFCQLSTNDAAQNKPLGEIAESRDMAALDTHTVTGAIEFILAYAAQTWNCPVCFFTSDHFGSDAYDAMVKRLYELQEKWGFGLLDLWNGEAFNTVPEEKYELYMYDPLHPTKAGYRMWWCPELERQFLAYLGERSRRKDEEI